MRRHLSSCFPTVSQIAFRRLDGLKHILLPSDQMTTHVIRGKDDESDIRDCGELKHVIGGKDDESEIIAESPCFSELRSLSLYVTVGNWIEKEMGISYSDNSKHIFYCGKFVCIAPSTSFIFLQ